MSLNRYNPARDANEREIAAVLKRAGCMVEPLSGKAIPDLLVGFAGRWLLMEVKTETGRLTRPQAIWHYEAGLKGLPVTMVRSPEEALKVLRDVVEQEAG